MQTGIHPEYCSITVKCNCGHTFTTNSTICKDLHVEVCNECHPFYTGKQKIVDTTGRVERFKGKFGAFSLNKEKSNENNEDASKGNR